MHIKELSSTFTHNYVNLFAIFYVIDSVLSITIDVITMIYHVITFHFSNVVMVAVYNGRTPHG